MEPQSDQSDHPVPCPRLVLDPTGLQWRAAAASGEVGAGPEVAAPQIAADVGVILLAQSARADALEGVDQLGKLDLRRVVHEQVDMVLLAVELLQLGFEVCADLTHAARAMGVDPAACLVVEDSRYGVASARAAGMRSLGFHGGLTPGHWLAGPGTRLFDAMRALPGLIAGAAGLALP